MTASWPTWGEIWEHDGIYYEIRLSADGRDTKAVGFDTNGTRMEIHNMAWLAEHGTRQSSPVR